ncbi:MAG TPA: hypothetical protein VIH11_01705 [Gemmatimonadaceae bacterium]
MARRPKLEDFFEPHLHRDLKGIEKRCWRLGIGLAQIVAILNHHVNVENGVRTLAPRRAAESKRTQRLRDSFLRALESARGEYDRARRNGRLVRSPIERHVRAILAAVARAERARARSLKICKALKTDHLDAATHCRLALELERSRLAVDWSDPLLSMRRRPGPPQWHAREALGALGVSRRDAAWLMRHAERPAPIVSR